MTEKLHESDYYLGIEKPQYHYLVQCKVCKKLSNNYDWGEAELLINGKNKSFPVCPKCNIIVMEFKE